MVTTPQNCNSSLGVSVVAIVTAPQNRQKLVFLCICALQTFCAHFSHVSNDSHLNSTHTRSSNLGVFAVAMVTTPT